MARWRAIRAPTARPRESVAIRHEPWGRMLADRRRTDAITNASISAWRTGLDAASTLAVLAAPWPRRCEGGSRCRRFCDAFSGRGFRSFCFWPACSRRAGARASGHAIALPRGEHALIPTLRGPVSLSPRALLAHDIWRLRQRTNAPNRALQELIHSETVPRSLRRMTPEEFVSALRKTVLAAAVDATMTTLERPGPLRGMQVISEALP